MYISATEELLSNINVDWLLLFYYVTYYIIPPSTGHENNIAEPKADKSLSSTSHLSVSFLIIIIIMEICKAPTKRRTSIVIRQFSEAGLHEWMSFVIFRARSLERLQRHFRADFWVGVASHCVWQWKLNLELWSSTYASTVAIAKIIGERGW